MHYIYCPSPLLTFAHLCRSDPCPGSIAMTVFLHASRSCASLGSSWWCLKSLCTRSIHLSLGLPRGLFPPTVIVVTCFATFVSSLLNTRPHQERRFWVIYVVIGLTIASLLNFSFLILSFLVLPWIQASNAPLLYATLNNCHSGHYYYYYNICPKCVTKPLKYRVTLVLITTWRPG